MRYPDLPDSLNDFLEKNLDLNAEGHNIYHIQSIDKDGNVTNEAFGLNTMTYSGLWNLYQNSVYWPNSENSSNWRGRLWLGSGTSTPDKNADVLEAPSTVITTQPTINNIWNDTPAEVYDSVSDTLSSTLKIIQYYYDYNISGVNSDYTFSEIGMNMATSWGYNIPGYNNYPLFVHALLYDSEGHQISFTKKMNERLYITIYFRYSMKMSIVRDLYDEGIYMACSAAAFSTHSRWGNGYWAFLSPLYDQVLTQTRMNRTYLFNGNASNNEIDIMSQSVNYSGSTLIESKYNSGISTIFLYDGDNGMDGVYRSMHLFVEDEKLPEPEELSSELVYVDGNQWRNTDHISIRHSFGGYYHTDGWLYTDMTGYLVSNYGLFPVADFNMTSSKMWNYSTGEWDIDENFDAQPSCYLNNTFALPTPMVLSLEGVRTNVYVYVNPRTDIPISKFHAGSWSPTSPMYATDEYWDTSTWGLISSPGTSIPANLQNKKYYIAKSIYEDNWRSGRIVPERVQNYPSIVIQNGGREISTSETITYTTEGYQFLSSDANNWFMTETKLYYPDIDVNPIIHQMPSVSRPSGSVSTADVFVASSGYRWNTDDRIFIADVSGHIYDWRGSWTGYNYNRFRVYTVSDDGTAPTYVEMRIDIGGNIVPIANAADGDTIVFANYFVYNYNGNRYVTFYVPNVAWKIGFVDIYGQDDVTPEITVLSGGLMAYAEPLYGTNLMIYHESFTSTSPAQITENSQWVLYDMSTKTVVDTFEFSSDYSGATINGVAGFSNHVYIKITKNSNVYTFHYDATTHQYAILEGFNDQAFDYSYPGVDSSQRFGHRYNRPQVYNEKCMYVFGYSGANNYSPQMSYIYMDDDPMHPVQTMLSENVDLRYMFARMPKLWETPDHKHLICTMDGITSWEGDAFGARVLDIGYYIKTKIPVRYPKWQARLGPEGSFTAIGYYKNGFIVNWPTGSLNWVPIEFYLPHKVTGTTRTIQSFNNPRVYSGMGFTFYVGLRDNLWKYDGRKVEFDGADAVQGLFYKKQNETLTITPTNNCLLVAIVFNQDSDVIVNENVGNPGYWTFKEQITHTYTGTVNKYMTVYTKQGVAGTTYTFTAKNGTLYTDESDGAFAVKVFALYGASSITQIANTAQTASSYSIPANTGKRRLIIELQPSNYNWDRDCPYKWSEPHHILPGLFTMPGRHAVWYDPFITDTTARTLSYVASWPGSGFSRFIIYEIDET